MRPLEQDPTIQNYNNTIGTRRGNDGIVTYYSKSVTRQAAYNFARFADLPITNDTFTKLIQYKITHKDDTTIEQTLQHFASLQPIRTYAIRASRILGIFRANFAPLSLRVNTHFDPPQENCTEGIFQEIYHAQDEETKDMIQWGQYVPERAKAAYRVPFEDIDLTRNDY
ncbi:MAG: hypothetical protein M1368_03145, partial [Thaumarchaeota archaeon]|nr:hypothetical protein [Nitrososphaerota archaeon]